MRSVSIRAAASATLVLTVLFASGCASEPSPDNEPAGMGVGQTDPDDNELGRHMDRDDMGQSHVDRGHMDRGHMDRGHMGPDDNNRGRHMGEDGTGRHRNGMMPGMPGMASSMRMHNLAERPGPDRLSNEVKGVCHGVS